MKKQYIRSERAHFMCPNMHFGIIIELSAAFDEAKLRDSVQKLAKVRPFLRCVIAAEGSMDTLYYKDTGASKTELVVLRNEDSLWDDYKKISETAWNVFEEGMLKLYAYPKEKGMTLLFIAHHLLTDGRGLLELVQTFAGIYTTGISPDIAEERLIESIEDLPEKSALSGISRFLVKRANKQWKKENHAVSYAQYCAFAKEYGQMHPVEFEMYEMEREELQTIIQECRNHGVSVNDWLMAEMYLRTGTEKIIIAADIRDRLKNYNPGSLGNYSTAMGIVYKAKSTNVMETAKEVRKCVQKHMNNTRALMLVLASYFEMEPALLDAAAISALGGFNSRAAQFVGGGMFGMSSPKSHSITNLGKVEDEKIDSLVFIPPASPAAKFTLGVVTLNGVLRACSSKNL
ncbi:MAG: hypothetical protein II230_05195 [Clostridia bacterium]|nr:hypothetical protein [Clostridia bacterium]